MPKANQLELFSSEKVLPEGFIYQPDFITPDEELTLVGEISRLEFSLVEMHGVVAKRRTAHFGWSYEYESRQLTTGQPIPEFLMSLRQRLGELTRVDPIEFGEVLISEYPAGAGIGWHRDAPMFGMVAGISLLGECRMRLRLHPSAQGAAPQTGKKKNRIIDQILEPRSAYVLQGPARTLWQHHIPPTKTLRYSITFRTLRSRVFQNKERSQDADPEIQDHD